MFSVARDVLEFVVLQEGNPGKRKLNKKEPKPEKGMPICPEWLLPEAKLEWKRLSEKLNQMGVLTEVDMEALLGGDS